MSSRLNGTLVNYDFNLKFVMNMNKFYSMGQN